MSSTLLRIKKLASSTEELKRFVDEVFKKVERDELHFASSR